MKIQEVESAAQATQALALAAERKFQETAQNLKGLKEKARQAKSKLKRAKKESRKARRISAKAAARAAKAQAKLVKARKKIAARKGADAATSKTTAATSKRAQPRRSARGTAKSTPVKDKPPVTAARPPRPRIAAKAKARAIDRPDADFDTEFNDADLNEIDSHL